MIEFIIIGLLLLPIHGVITDLKEGKIKNYFIFPSLVSLIVLGFFIEWFYSNKDNLISFGIVSSFAYLFYKNNKWWAWDGKYLMLLGLSTIIIGYLKGLPYFILHLFVYAFSIFLIYVVGFLIMNFRKIPKIDFRRTRIHVVDMLSLSGILLIASIYIIQYLPKVYSFLMIFIFMMLLLPIIQQSIRNTYVKYIVIGICLCTVLYKNLYISYSIIVAIYILFQYLQDIFDQVFDIIDTMKLKIAELNQGNILTKESREKIEKDSWIETAELPLQGVEVYNILDFYKKAARTDEEIIAYKDIKLWIILYISYVAIILQYIRL